MTIVLLATLMLAPDDLWVVYPGGEGPGKGKHIVLVSGDEEYRSEEAMPMLGQILARRHGFTCTVLFAVDPKTGQINPNVVNNIPGLEALAKADLFLINLRFRELPDDQMKHIVEYVDSGRPIIGLRTATHAFNYKGKSAAGYHSWSFNSKEPAGGFGRAVLGETWVNHHGAHGSESCRGVIADGAKTHPIVRGCEDIWGPTDVYTAKPPADVTPLVMGQVLKGMKPTDAPVDGPKNSPMMPIAWTREYKGARIFTTTMGASQDFESEGLRRLVVNASYWCVGLEGKIPERANVEFVTPYKPTPFGHGKAAKDVTPADHKLKE